MRIVQTLLFFVIPLLLAGQENLIVNPSLEVWEQGAPKDWQIDQNTVDIFRSNYRLIPMGVKVNNLKWRSRFPASGSHGLSYFGIADDEIISCALKRPLIPGQYYELSFYVYNPPIFSEKTTNKFTVRITTAHQTAEEILLLTEDKKNKTEAEWTKISKVIKAPIAGDRMQFGFFGNHYNDLEFNAAGLYYLFDDVSLIELSPVSDTIYIYFKTDEYKIPVQEKAKLLNYDCSKLFQARIKILGFASESGDSLHNYLLSEKRAENIEHLLTDLNCGEIELTRAFGETRSSGSNNKTDRKVEVIINYLKKPTSINSDRAYSFAFNPELATQLKDIEKADQTIRIRYDSIFNTLRHDTIQLKRIEEEMIQIDSINKQKVVNLFESTGYPGLSTVGPDYMDVGFLIMQHADLQTRIKYEPLLLDAIAKGEATKYWLPYFIDRNKVDQGKDQIFGTQLFWNEKLKRYECFKIENPEAVDDLRREYNLGKLQDYLKYVNTSDDKN